MDTKSYHGGARRDRTADLYRATVALSQLSYGPTGPRRIAGRKRRGMLRITPAIVNEQLVDSRPVGAARTDQPPSSS